MRSEERGRTHFQRAGEPRHYGNTLLPPGCLPLLRVQPGELPCTAGGGLCCCLSCEPTAGTAGLEALLEGWERHVRSLLLPALFLWLLGSCVLLRCNLTVLCHGLAVPQPAGHRGSPWGTALL